MNEKTFIKLGNNKPPVIITEDPIKDFKRCWQLTIGTHKPTPVFFLVDKTPYGIFQNILNDMFEKLPVKLVGIRKINGGENSKQWQVAGEIIEEWIKYPITKDTVIVCFGGGTITDLGGFMASVFKRGLRTVYIPTTLMAMTDASIGGKNAVNFNFAKNQIGTIYFPKFTFISPLWLSSLPENEIKSGYSEIMKHALLDKSAFVKTILSVQDAKIPPSTSLLTKSIRTKLRIITSDPFENNKRMWLNFGHSFGHAYEGFFLSAQKPLSHGHAVAIGIVEALYFSSILYNFPRQLLIEVLNWFKQMFDFDELPEWKTLQPYILQDKKNLSSGIRLILLKSPGNPLIDQIEETRICELHNEFINKLRQNNF
jgi:3-dehydroquinate synthase